MASLVFILGSLIGGMIIVYASWYLFNAVRKSIRYDLYSTRSSIFLAIGTFMLSAVFLYAIFNGSYSWKLVIAAGSLISFGLSMYFNENESIKKQQEDDTVKIDQVGAERDD